MIGIRALSSYRLVVMLSGMLAVAAIGTSAEAKTIIIDYLGGAPPGAMITVSASGVGGVVNPSYQQTFDISGLTSTQAIKYVLNGTAPGKPTLGMGMVGYGTNAAINAAGNGINVTTILAIGVFVNSNVPVTSVDITPNKPAKNATLSNYALAAADPTIINPFGVPQNVALLSVGAGFPGGGPGGTDGAGGGQLLLDVNSTSVSADITDGETYTQAADALYTSLSSDGFVLGPPDAFGNLELDFSDPANFSLTGSPSMISIDFGFSSTANNLDLDLDTSVIPEPAPAAVIVSALIGLLALRRGRRPQRVHGP